MVAVVETTRSGVLELEVVEEVPARFVGIVTGNCPLRDFFSKILLD